MLILLNLLKEEKKNESETLTAYMYNQRFKEKSFNINKLVLTVQLTKYCFVDESNEINVRYM